MARPKARYEILPKASRSKTQYVGFYIRLSREDSRGNDESGNVHNQRFILADRLNNQFDSNKYVLVDEFVDDRVSGTTDKERPDFQRLLRSVEAGKINYVVMKDLTRSFRNRADQGYYLEDWFVIHQMRFISLYQQPIDTYKDPYGATNIGIPVQGVLDESHTKDTSENVRKVFSEKREKGLHIGPFAACGYEKSPEDKNALVIGEEAAEVVRDIFSWFLDGMSKNAIVRTLNERGVLCPSLYRQSRGMEYKNPGTGNQPLWNAETIIQILKNRLYVGDIMQGRYRIRSYKIHIQDAIPREEWLIVENTHEPIIDWERFAQVRELLKRDTRMAPGKKKLYLFNGFLRCAEYGKSMCRGEVKGTIYYFCRTYKEQSKAACTKHSIKHSLLEATVLYVIQQQVYVADVYAGVMAHVDKAPLKKSQSNKLDGLIAAKGRELAKVTHYEQSLYQDWKDGSLAHKDCHQIYEDYKQQMEDIDAAIKDLMAERIELEKNTEAENPVLTTYRKYGNIDKLTRGILIELVDHIQVFENGSISVRLKYSDETRRMGESIKANHHLGVG